MRKIACIISILLISTMTVCADMGMPPDNPIYTCIIGFDGAKVMHDESGKTLPAGVTFYVYRDSYPNDDSLIEGTTDGTLTGRNSDQFVWIRKADTLSGDYKLSPEQGVKLEDAYNAKTTDALNLRCGPGTGFKVVKVLDKGTKVEYQYTYKADTTWMYVTTGKLKGWVSGDYLQETGKAQKEEPATVDVEQEPEKEQLSTRTTVLITIACCIFAACIVASVAYFVLKKKAK